ncbi:DUF1338-domain-containing protein [Annulohypoxylon maeteangense]|uniref:DUF1338-domain-containing protein n=1 Tax=Annulohypoxylon maeteangense TaxID=1927788 RepID=UPI0020077753|nr:DUF1338-domain-containing protein [Annulohypoxylon maeteangense]KAI0886677.1 DUF1338-domain-containing protein [Annulohypoxylon maeteangense]
MALSDEIRADFAAALSKMYQKEVPQYGTLLKLVSEINHQIMDNGQPYHDTQHRIEVERHGAIRLGLASELAMIRRLFAVMGMEPVGYYDLTVAGLPVHATGFRPISPESLQRNPFRVFTSLLRLDLIQDKNLREQAERILNNRSIFTPRCIELIEQFEAQGGLSEEAAREFVKESLETFRWHETSTVDLATYKALESSHPLIADVVCFKGPHINHLTPRVLDIDAAQDAMKKCGLEAKSVIEGPPPRKHLILLRQTSFLALEEEVAFSSGEEKGGKHRARFGEIEQRGIALTAKGHRLYDELLAKSKEIAIGQPQNSQEDVLAQTFATFPDDLNTLYQERLAYFRYVIRDPLQATSISTDLDSLVSSRVLSIEPITYEDFLPASAAGIFYSNLHEGHDTNQVASSDQASFEKALGCGVHQPFDLYDGLEKSSIAECLGILAEERKAI